MEIGTAITSITVVVYNHGHYLMGLKTVCLLFGKGEGYTFIISTYLCIQSYLHKVIPGFLHCFLMEEEFLSSALKIQTEE